MKRLIMLTSIICLLLTAAARAIANPWLDLTQEELAAQAGVVVCLPAGAENVAYRLLPEMALAEVQFTWQDWKCVFRAAPGETLTDITGLYCTWETQADCTVAGCAGYVWRAESVSVCLWYDGTRSCSFALVGPEAGAADVRAAAEAVSAPLRLADALRGCTGYAGTAGATLKAAQAACGLLQLTGAPAEEALPALMALTAAEKAELALNLSTLDWLITGALSGDGTVLATFADAGIADVARDVMPTLTADAWVQLLAVLQQELGE